MGQDKNWAVNELINPLIGPDPSDETGLNSHFRSSLGPQDSYPSPSSSTSSHEAPRNSESTNPFRRSVNTKAPMNQYPSPPASASPRRSKFHEESLDLSPDRGNATSINHSAPLKEHYPGNLGHQPVETTRPSKKATHRSLHPRKKHYTGADTIDRLDANPLGQTYHHEGPYDATLMSRNTRWESSPLAAVSDSNNEAIKATPEENIRDAIERHRPLEGIASIPPGGKDKFGRVYNYEQGVNLAREEGGQYKIWPGQDLPPEAIYADDKTIRAHRKYLGIVDTNGRERSNEYEMKTRPRNKSLSYANETEINPGGYDDTEGEGSGLRRSHTTGRRVSEGLKRRFGSLRKKKESA